MKSGRWSEEDVLFLIENYHIESYQFLQNRLNRKYKAIRSKASAINLSSKNNPKNLQRLSQKEAEQKSLNVGIKMIGKYVNNRTNIQFLCPFCGKIWLTQPDNVWCGKIISCGCYHKYLLSKTKRKDIGDQKFGKLTTIKDVGSKHKSRQWLCICECGNQKIVSTNTLTRGGIQSCGNCSTFRNGKATSIQALKLHKMVGNYGEHNGFIGKMNCDIVLPSKIVVEYDEWYWHKNSLKKDQHKTKKLLNKGYKVLRIKAKRNLPTQQQLDKAIFDLIMTPAKQRTIVLNGWGKE